MLGPPAKYVYQLNNQTPMSESRGESTRLRLWDLPSGLASHQRCRLGSAPTTVHMANLRAV